MGDSSPTKRRKTKGALAVKPVKPSWPENQLPVEIFDLIIAYLPRSTIQNMRLVNKEFEEKVAEVLFRSVVVPFKPEIYEINSDNALANEVQGAIMLQDKGMRVFQGFGRWIQKFAMSFEIDLNKLMSPPAKSNREAITSFWGIYLWPFRSYNRYTQLAGLEQTADETRSMAKALRFVNRAEELGLSIDGGLGWLEGPDTNLRTASRSDKFPVFGSSRFISEPNPKQHKLGIVGQAAHNQNGSIVRDLKRILEEAGYYGDDLDDAIGMLLESEGMSFQVGGQEESYPRGPFRLSSLSQDSWRLRRHVQLNDGRTDPTLPFTDLDNPPNFEDVNDADDDFRIVRAPILDASNHIIKNKADTYPLKPNDLSIAQREMLLEMEWAQSAFMQSWSIAVIDNNVTFKHVRKLTISRLPHCHLSILCRQDFWESLPSLNSLWLAVIPDWREVRKEATSYVHDNRIAPSQSIPGVYKLLDEYVSKTKNITSLHFEWICGGEYASGMFARNQLILAAPIVPKAMDMVNRTAEHPVLSLLFIQHLSLKNCWSSPHILKRLLHHMRTSSLKSLSFDSVSLTAEIAPNAQPRPAAQAAAFPQNHQIAQNMAAQAAAQAGHAAQFQNINNFWQGQQNLQNPQPVQIIQLPAPPVQQPQPAVAQVVNNGSQAWLQSPRPGSWPEIVDEMSPSTTLADIRFERDIGPEPEPRESSSLKKLIFNSCGYVHLPLDFDQTSIDHPQAGAQANTNTTRRVNDIETYMMKPLEPTLGTIINSLSQVEKITLESAWNLNIGWDQSKNETILDAQLDGIMNPGHGRFEGIIEAPLSPSRRY